MHATSQKQRVLLLDDVGPNEAVTKQVFTSTKLYEQYDVAYSLAPHHYADYADFECEFILHFIDFPDSENLEILSKINTLLPNIPLVVITLKSMLAFDVSALTYGADDILILNELNEHRLARSLQFAKARHEQKQQLKSLTASHENATTHDAITQLPNRQLLEDRLTYTLTNAHRYKHYFGILVIGLDGFQTINETLGHRKGDTILKETADRVQKVIRRADTLARLGSDEFILILSQVNHPQDVLAIAEHILSAISQPYILGGREIFLTASIGISRYPDDGLDADPLLKHAYAALYDAKANGKNQYQLYHPNIVVKDDSHLRISNDLHRAIEREEFEIYYQPQVDVIKKRIFGFEALLRWNHPHFGMIPPSEFIPIAESKGLIIPINEWVFANACQQLTTWHSVGLNDLSISVNVAANEFKQAFFVEKVKSILNQSGLHPKYLRLEITEGMIMQDPNNAVTLLKELRGLGVNVALDDFGTGYSSLSYLKLFPIDTLKIDRSFVRDLIINKDNTKIVNAIIGLAHSLQMHVVAEGVENEAQKNFLLENDCHLMQGFLFSKALPVREATQLLLEPDSHIRCLGN